MRHAWTLGTLAAVGALLLLGAGCSPALAAVAVWPESQVSIPSTQPVYNRTAAGGLEPLPDLPLNAPPLLRTVTGFQPEGIHLTPWTVQGTSHSMLVSWQTGEPLVANNSAPPTPYDPLSVNSIVRWGTESGKLTERTQQQHQVVYTYVYGPEAGNSTYASPIIHHVLLSGLAPKTTYFYSVGDDAHGWSEELNFTTLGPPGSYPLRLGVLGDLARMFTVASDDSGTYNSTQTLAGMIDSSPDAVLFMGDYVYANEHESGNTTTPGFSITNLTLATSEQPRWDGWARMMQPLMSHVPWMGTGGNHEIEPQISTPLNQTHTAVNARYPVPQDPKSPELMTGPNHGAWYLNQSLYTEGHSSFINESGYVPQSAFYSHDLPGVHIISLSSYLPYGSDSQQYSWLLQDLAGVDRQQTPWLVVFFHAPFYHSYVQQYKQADTFRSIYEPVFYEHGVDIVFSGHVHSCERTLPMYNYTTDPCGAMHIIIGDGGNLEGTSQQFIDEAPQPSYCANVSLYKQPGEFPTPTGDPVLSLQNGSFCPSSQPDWSAFREPSFGFGTLDILNETHAVWEWQRNPGGSGPGQSDRVELSRVPAGTCNSGPTAAPLPPKGAAEGRSSNTVLSLLMTLVVLLALPALLFYS